MKIVGTDNLARETIADYLWLDAIPDTVTHREFAQRVCDKLNEGLRDDGRFYQIKSDSYRMSRGMEDFI